MRCANTMWLFKFKQKKLNKKDSVKLSFFISLNYNLPVGCKLLKSQFDTFTKIYPLCANY